MIMSTFALKVNSSLILAKNWFRSSPSFHKGTSSNKNLYHFS